MGISIIEIKFLELALQKGLIFPNGHMLELGESNIIPEDAGPSLLSLVQGNVPNDRIKESVDMMNFSRRSRTGYQQFYGTARALYHAIFDPASYTAIDLDQGPRRYCLDLNMGISLNRQFDYVINNGTSEHIFDQANVFRTVHDHTRPGGIMIHMTPCLGWINHGLYNVQPGFFFDLCTANGYTPGLIALASSQLCVPLTSGDDVWRVLQDYPALANAEICVLLRKGENDVEFRAPQQGSYGGASYALHLARIPRRRLPQTRTNLALNQPADQSSTSYWSWHDHTKIDAAGGNDGRITGFYGFCTEFEAEPWWEVDLGQAVPIQEILVFNRIDGDAWAQRAAHLCISLSNDHLAWHPVFTRTSDSPFGGADGRPLRVELTGKASRFVRLSLPETNFLHLDEVEIY
jgi:SAM-dependent methyltransferase